MEQNSIIKSFNFEKAIERHKTKLLDLSRRNQLLNFRFFKRSTVKIIDEIPSEVFKDMVVNNKKFDFLDIVEDEEDHELDISSQSIEHHVYDESSLPDKHTDTSLQTDQTVKDLQLGLKILNQNQKNSLRKKVLTFYSLHLEC